MAGPKLVLMGYEKQLFIGTAGNVAATQLLDVVNIKFTVDATYGSTTSRGLGTSVPIGTSRPTSRKPKITFNTLAVPANGPIRMSPANPDHIIFCDYDKVYHSADGLQSRRLVLTATDRVDDVAFAPAKPGVIYLATRGYSIYKSSNFGATWIQLVNLRTAGILN